MAKRVLKDWTASERMDSISLEAEVFFTRLIMKADDYGSYYANIKLLKAALYPLKEVTRDQVRAWLMECIKADLILMYEVDGKGYIRIKDFGQRLRNMRNCFPHPPDTGGNSQQVAADRGECPPETKRNEVETEDEPASASLYVNGNVPRGRFTIDSYPNGQKAFEEIQADELMVERLLRVVHNEGYKSCDAITVMTGVRRFITAEEAKPDFTSRPRDDLKKHLVNWIRTNAKTLNQYG